MADETECESSSYPPPVRHSPYGEIVNSTKCMPRELTTCLLPLETRASPMNRRGTRGTGCIERKQRASPRAPRTSRQPSVAGKYPWSPLDACLAERFWQALSSLSAPVRRATNISQFADSICCSIRCGQLYEGVRQRDCHTSVRLARCWAHPQLAAGRAAGPPQQIHHDAAAAPGRPPTAHWLPSRGRAQASRRSCVRRRPKRRATPHR